MRILTAGMVTELARTNGVEPLVAVEIQWVPQGNNFIYADRDTDFADGKILNMSPLDFVVNINDGSDSAEIRVTLDDTDNVLKGIMDTQDVHKRRVWVYFYTEDTTYATDKVLMFSGEINSPLTWNEGDRSIKFSVISKIEDAEVGFSMEEGEFNQPPQELIGVPWPLKFGTTIRVPALRLSDPLRGVLSTGVGIADFTLPFRIASAGNIICPLTFRGFKARYDVFMNLYITPVFVTDEGCALDRCYKVRTLTTSLNEQRDYEFEKIVIIDGEKFPQGEILTLDIEGGKFVGSFDGNVFTIQERIHPRFDELGGIPNTNSVNALIEAEYEEGIAAGCAGLGVGYYLDGTPTNVPPTDLTRQLVEESERSIAFYNAIPEADFFFANPGATVTIDSGEEIVYVSNILEETVSSVVAYRNFDAGRKLVTVPSSYYTVRTTDFNSYMMTEIVFAQPLSLIDDTWEDDIYVNSVSSIGPNTVDIMEWLIEKYTNLSIDSTSFDDVKTKLENYPSDFPLLERKNVLNVLQEIAFQCRCSIYIRDNTFYLKYLSEEPTEVTTISESDVDFQTLELFHTDTEQLVTKLIAEWKQDYSITDNNKIVLRHNVEKYGTQEDTFNFYIYNELDYVHKSATFWIIRKANTWRQLRFSTPIHKLILESFDGVTINIATFSGESIRGVISKSDYNSETQSLDFEVWTPVKSGTTIAYDFAFPANIAQELFWPTPDEIDANLVGSGTAPGFTTFAPPGHPLVQDKGLIQGFQVGPCLSQGLPLASFAHQTCGGGAGDTYPSDTGDTIKEKTPVAGAAPDSPIDPGDINVGDPRNAESATIEALKRRIADLERRVANAQQTSNNANEESEGEGSSGNQPQDDPFEALPDPDDVNDGSCDHRVTIFLVEAVALFKGGVLSNTGKFGADTPVGSHVLRFSTRCEALEVQNKILARHAARQAAEDYTMGGGPYPVNAIATFDNSPDCLGSGTPSEPGVPPIPTGYRDDQTGAGAQPSITPADYWSSLGLVDGC